jgi:membrane-associated phospholipid phosphatase
MDESVSVWMYRNVGLNKNLGWIPFYLGLVPYELLVIPGMYVSIMIALYFDTLVPLQIYLFPLLITYSVVSNIKNAVKRLRPGCDPSLKISKLIDSKHSTGDQRFKSFPSGHTIMAFSLATSLTLKENPYWLIIWTIAANIGIHRISYGYHYLSDVVVGALLGSFIGYMCFKFLEPYAEMYNHRFEKEKSKVYEVGKPFVIIACIIAILHYYYKLSF